jgi:pimeloyl-ACP methyl ester carboxylesterase
MSGSLGFGTAHLARLDLSLVAVDRPGLGDSSPHPGKTLASWVDDVADLLGRLGQPEVYAVGFSQGSVFAAALAGAGLVRAAALVSGQDDLRAVRGELPPEVRTMLDEAAADPVAFEAEVAEWAGADRLWDLVVGMSSPADRAYYTGGAFGAAYREALDEGFAQGAGGYARDLVTAIGDWYVAPEQVGVPVDLWYGGGDTSPVHSPDQGRGLAARFPRGRLHLLPDEGGSLLWTRSADILVGLLQR